MNYTLKYWDKFRGEVTVAGSKLNLSRIIKMFSEIHLRFDSNSESYYIIRLRVGLNFLEFQSCFFLN